MLIGQTFKWIILVVGLDPKMFDPKRVANPIVAVVTVQRITDKKIK
jgi:hypothetical protein